MQKKKTQNKRDLHSGKTHKAEIQAFDSSIVLFLNKRGQMGQGSEINPDIGQKLPIMDI